MVSSGEKVERVCANCFFYCYWRVPYNSYLRKIRFILAHSLRAYSSSWWQESEEARHMCPVSWRTAMNAGTSSVSFLLSLVLHPKNGVPYLQGVFLNSNSVSPTWKHFHRHAHESVSRVAGKHSRQWRGVITKCERTSILLPNSSGESEIQVPLRVPLLAHLWACLHILKRD